LGVNDPFFLENFLRIFHEKTLVKLLDPFSRLESVDELQKRIRDLP
jgi:hypothetical protein